jgi:anti-sigma-K factor RskA
MNTELEELACLYVLDRLDTADRAAFEARLIVDPGLAALTGELEAALARRIDALPRHVPSDAVAARIEARIDRLTRTGSAGEHAFPGGWAAAARWGIAAVVALGVGAAAFLGLRKAQAPTGQPHMIVAELDASRSTLAELPIQMQSRDSDASFIQLASLAERYWKRPEDLPVKMAPDGTSGRGYALFDPGTNEGFIAIRHLPEIEGGKRYHLWMVDTDSGKVREAGALPLAESSHGLYFFSVAGAPSGRVDFFVTAEEGSGPEPTSPRGKVVLGDGKF